MTFRFLFPARICQTLCLYLIAAGSIAPAIVSAQQSAKPQEITSAHLLVGASESPTPGRTSVARDKNADLSRARQSIATVDGQPIYEEDFPSTLQGQLLSLRNQEYEAKRKALDALIEQKMLDIAAKKKGVSTEQFLEQEVNSKIPDVTDAEMQGYYLGLRIQRPFAEVKPQLKEALKQAKISQARQDYLKNLRSEMDVAVLLTAPVVEVASDPSRVRGNPNPKVMIVEFSDYQCPYCHSVEPTLKEVLAKYGDRVSLSYRDFPLSQIHSNAELAAEASRCAQEQGKFWEYHDLLFTVSTVDKDTLVGFARNLKLDDKQFDSCLTSEKYKTEIEKDLQEGRKAGVTGTPAFFINGSSTSGAQQQETFVRMIDEALARNR